MPRGGIRPGSGRKRKPEAKRLRAHPLTVYLEGAEREQLEDAAKESGQSLASYSRAVLVRALKRRRT